MGGDFRAIRRAAVPAAAAPEPDPRLALVDLFAAGQSAPQGDADTEPQPDPAERALELLSVPVEDEIAQEPSEEPQEEPEQTAPAESPEAAQPDETIGSEDAEPKATAEAADYDPIAAVLG